MTKGSDSWSLGELVHALVILSSYHAISSFVFGVGIGDGEDEPPCSSKSTAAITITTPTAATPSGNSSSGQSTPTSTSGSPPQLTNGGSGGSPLVSATREIVTTSATAAAIGTFAPNLFMAQCNDSHRYWTVCVCIYILKEPVPIKDRGPILVVDRLTSREVPPVVDAGQAILAWCKITNSRLVAWTL